MTISCYRVQLTMSSIGTAGKSGDRYVAVEDGYLYLVAPDIKAVGREFPDALKIERIGVGYDLAEPEEVCPPDSELGVGER